MSKELEALNQIETHIEMTAITDGVFKTLKRDYLDVIRKALTPPTADEVCKALEEEYGKKFYYSKGEKIFYTWSEGGKTAFTGGNGQAVGGDVHNMITLGMFKLGEKVRTNPHLITLIGRFYEGLEE